jgi:eukaryotic-like serine/threonine-protein kinase
MPGVGREHPSVPASFRGGDHPGNHSVHVPRTGRWESVDARSHIFSFGSVLYEMLTGRRAFASDSKASTLFAILHQEPTPLGDLVKDVPSELTRIVTQCLRKDPARRFQHFDDVRILLEQLREDIDRGTLSGGTGAVLPVRRKIIQPAIAVVALLGLLAAAVFVWWLNRTGPASEGPVFTRVTSDAGLTTDPALSPDGRLLAYASDRATAGGAHGNLDIWVQQVGSGEPLRLTRHDADDHEPSFSPDGTRIVFRSERDGGGIYMVPALGGDARLIARDGRRPRFSPDGQSIVYWTGSLNQSDVVLYGRIFVVPAVGGRPKEVRPGSEDASHPVWSPDGKRLLFRRYVVGRPTWSVTTLDGSVADSDTEGFFEGRGLTDATPMAWLPEQDRIVFTARLGDSLNVWQAPISLQTLKLTAAPERLTSGSGLESKPAVVALPGDGIRLVFAGLLENINIGGIALDADTGRVTGTLEFLTENVATDSNPALTLDGRRLFFSSNRTGNRDIWVKDLATGKETNLTNTPVGENRPTITRDGSKLACRLMERPDASIQVMAVSQDSTGVPQSGVPQKVSVSGRCGYPWSWSSDGAKLIYNCPAASAVLLFDSKTSESSQIFLAGRIYQVYFSPDDHWLAFGQHYPHGRERIFVAPFARMAPPAEKDWIAITDGNVYDAYGRWSPDGNLLYFLSDRDGFRCLWAQRLDRLRKSSAGAPFPIYHSHSSRHNLLNVPLDWQDISVAHDKIAFAMGEITGNIWMADLKGQR